jgi:hypothetical protein
VEGGVSREGLDSMSRDTLETLDDEGDVFASDGTFYRRMRYHILVFQRLIDDGRGRWIRGGVTRTEASVDVEFVEGNQLVATNDVMTLHLADGRWFDFRLNSASGTISSAGRGFRDER